MVMTIAKEQRFAELDNTRHELEITQQDKLVHLKDDEIREYKKEREQVRTQFNANHDLQDSFKESQLLKDDIEEANVKWQWLCLIIK